MPDANIDEFLWTLLLKTVKSRVHFGVSGSPMTVMRGANLPRTIDWVDYSAYAIDQMEGGILPSVARSNSLPSTRSRMVDMKWPRYQKSRLGIARLSCILPQRVGHGTSI
jgi:hypothetical protein